jgi:hypothetical protein
MMLRRYKWLLCRLGLLFGAGAVLQLTTCELFRLPNVQDLADFAVLFSREALAAYLL